MRKLASIISISFCLAVLALSPRSIAQVIQIPDVEELYSAVNNSANAGMTLVLSPGTYMLSAIDPNGAERPKGGRIELQPDMSLMGVVGDRDAVVINAFNLPASSFPQAAGPNAPIRMGLGHNALEWLTVRDAVNAQANIDTGLQPLDPGDTFITVAHVASTGSLRGMEVINYGPQTSGQTIEADIVDCYLFDNILGLGEGIRIGSFVGAKGGTVNIRMLGNLLWGNQTGQMIENARAQNSMVNVFSSGNRFYGNGAGTIIFGGISTNNTRSDGNTVNFEAHGDQFVENTGPTTADPGGLFVEGTENASSVSGGGSNNTVNISLWGCRMLDNSITDLYGVGARSVPDSTASLSQNNHVTIEIHGDGDDNGKWQPVEFFANSLPETPDEGNSVTVIR